VLFLNAGIAREVDAGDHAERLDVLASLVATDGAIRHLGIDLRRLRPNVAIRGVEGRAERSCPELYFALGKSPSMQRS